MARVKGSPLETGHGKNILSCLIEARATDNFTFCPECLDKKHCERLKKFIRRRDKATYVPKDIHTHTSALLRGTR